MSVHKMNALTVRKTSRNSNFVSLLFNCKGIIHSMLSLVSESTTLEIESFRVQSLLLLFPVEHSDLNIYCCAEV